MTWYRQATFNPNDPQEVVDETFACPYCGGQSGIPRLFSYGKRWATETIALCHCTTCTRGWTIGLDLAQSLRLTQYSVWRGAHPGELPDIGL